MKKKLFLLTVALLCAVVQGAWAQTEVSTEEALRTVINENGSNKSVKMTADIQLGSRLVIDNGKNVTLDLNGHKLSRSLTDYADDGNVIRVETGGQLTVKDSGGNDSGQITGGKAINGGGICNHGTLTFEGGTITGCSASSNGGGIFNAPATADGYPTTLTVKGGKVTGNTCGDRGAGIFNYPGCFLNIQGTVNVSGNTKGSEANNVYLDGETVFTVTGALTGSHIGVSIEQSCRTISSGYGTNNSADGATFFSSDNSQFGIAQNGDEMAIGTLVTFNVRSWDEERMQVVTTQATRACTLIEGSHPEGWMTLTDGYYAVNSDAEYKALAIAGSDTHLVLCDGATLNCAHVKLETGNTLNIYSQSDGDTQGKLLAVNQMPLEEEGGVYRYAAAIGGGDKQDMGSLFIHGGNIEAKCCTIFTDYECCGAGIGGGRKKGIGADDRLVIYGGNVTSIGSYYGAGIGGAGGSNLSSGSGDQGGPVIIYGGSVNAQGSVFGAGIGGGNKGNGGVVKIYGGRMSATGGCSNNGEIGGAGIGGGDDGDGGQVYIYGGEIFAYGGTKAAGIGGSDHHRGNTLEVHGGYLFATSIKKVNHSAPAIGGGYSGNGDAVLITGGTVCTVKLGDYCALIGGGYDDDDGSLIVNEGLKVSWGTQADAISDNRYQTLRTGAELGLTLVENADQRVAAIQNRSYTCALIEPCNHQGTGSTYTYADEDYHNVTCKACGYTGQEAHTYNGDNTCACGKKKDATADLWSVMLHRATGAASTSYEDRVPMMVVKGQPLTVPAVSATQGLRLLGYVEAADAPTGIMLLETEKSSLIKVGDELTPSADMDLYARYGYVFNTAWTWAADASSASVTLSHAALSPVTLSSTDGKVTITPRVLTDDAGNVIGKRYVATCTYTLNGYEYTFTNNYQHQDISIMDDDDNSEAIDYYEDTIVNATLTDRTLYKDGSWNTLYLPFSLSTLNGTPLEGATVKTLRSSSFDSSTGTLTLNFSEALTRIESGTPYIIKWDKADDYVDDDEHNIVNPVFTDVTISYVVTISDAQSETPESACAEFVGSFSPVNLEANDRSVLYLGADNTLYYPSADKTVNSCRAVFRLKGIEAGDLPQQARRFVLNFGDDEETTGISSLTPNPSPKGEGSWYDLQGRRISVPSATSVPSVLPKGVYINNGKKIIIK